MNERRVGFDTVLVANRGEIACRILRTIRSMGLRGVAVYSEADADAPHRRLADQAVCIGPAPATESYLSVARILEAAAASGADAVHPGYGFLSENAEFARACAEAGLVFIGPTPEAIAAMGDKAEARRLMTEAGVACVPGYDGEDQSDEAFEAAAEDIGYPVMVKAAAGGGGRGMRRVASRAELAGALDLARSESRAAFGSARLILEHAVERARHVEIQILADHSGNTVHLGERDCSIQRRHQKVIEEAPSPAVTPALRRDMGAAAVAAARAIEYRGAGTVEFLLAEDGRFWFLEMNTRLQVEHPVTECVTGLDLVECQLRIAAGEPLGLTQDDIRIEGHAIEARLYTEDAEQDFRPTTGRVERWQAATGPGLRTDEGVAQGQVIGPWYDALAAKIVASGPDRQTARRRLIGGLRGTLLFGPETNKDFLIACLEDPGFAAGTATTEFLAEGHPATGPTERQTHAADVAAAVIRFRLDRQAALDAGPGVAPELLDWSSGLPLTTRCELAAGARQVQAELRPLATDRYRVTVGDRASEVRIELADGDRAGLLIDGVRATVRFSRSGEDGLWLSVDGREHLYGRIRPGHTAAAEAADGEGHVVASMHGLVESVAVAAGDRVAEGQRLLVIEAMKMQQEILAPSAGTVAEIHVRPGRQVATGEPLVTIEPSR
jgi:geranyl-CoA carboxylase alpha subunit